MRQALFHRGARVLRAAVTLVVLAAPAPCLAQSAPAAPAPSAATLPPGDVVAFATLSLSVAQARDSIQNQLAQPRNKTPQAQQQLRDQLATQVAQILQRAGMSDEEYRRKTYLVSTDSASRAVFDSTMSKLTGAPLLGQLAATTPVVVSVPAGPVGVHIGHVMNAVDPTVALSGPGLGYGVKRAALGVAAHVNLAAKAPGASPNVVTHANHVGTSARNTVQRADAIVALAQRIQAATSASDAAAARGARRVERVEHSLH